MQVVANTSSRAFAERFIGRTMEVLWETASRDRGPATDAVRSRPSRWSGYTDNYIRVTTASHANLHNRIMQAELVTLEQDEVEGRLTQKEVQVSLV
jgi:hypothetical protein